MGFVANFIRLLAVQKFWKSENQLRFDRVTESLKVGTFLRHSLYALYMQCVWVFKNSGGGEIMASAYMKIWPHTDGRRVVEPGAEIV